MKIKSPCTLKDEVRREWVMELLLGIERPIKQVAEAAGFLNEKSFMRAFKGWTGQSPGAFRGGVAGEVLV